jgi:hypothetical protein
MLAGFHFAGKLGSTCNQLLCVFSRLVAGGMHQWYTKASRGCASGLLAVWFFVAFVLDGLDQGRAGGDRATWLYPNPGYSCEL